MSTNGQLVFTDVDKITFKGVGNASNAVVDTLTGKIGVGTDSPEANLHVLGNSYVSTNLELGGTLIMGTVNVEAQHSLEAVTATGNITPLTIQFTNPTTSLVASGNVVVTGNVTADHFVGDGSNITGISSTLQAITDSGNVTSNTVQFSNAITGFVTTANVEVGGELTVSGNVAMDTNTLFVDSVNDRVGIGTTSPNNSLHIYKAAAEGTSGLFIEKASGGTGTTAALFFGVSAPGETTNAGIPKAAIFYERNLSNGRGDIKFCNDEVNDANAVTTEAADTRMIIKNNGDIGVGTVSPSRTLDVHGSARPGGFPFAIGGTWTNRAHYVSKTHFPGVNKSSYSVDFLIGGSERMGWLRACAGGSQSGSGTIVAAAIAEFIISPYGTNFYSVKKDGSSGISISSSGTHNGGRITVSLASTSYPRLWFEIYHEYGVYW